MGNGVTIHDRRQVRAELPDDCISHTPKGHAPLRCTRVEITYDIETGELGSVTVWGHLTDADDIRRRAEGRLGRSRDEAASSIMQRRYAVDWHNGHTADLPDWLAAYVEKYRPVPS